MTLTRQLKLPILVCRPLEFPSSGWQGFFDYQSVLSPSMYQLEVTIQPLYTPVAPEVVRLDKLVQHPDNVASVVSPEVY